MSLKVGRQMHDSNNVSTVQTNKSLLGDSTNKLGDEEMSLFVNYRSQSADRKSARVCRPVRPRSVYVARDKQSLFSDSTTSNSNRGHSGKRNTLSARVEGQRGWKGKDLPVTISRSSSAHRRPQPLFNSHKQITLSSNHNSNLSDMKPMTVPLIPTGTQIKGQTTKRISSSPSSPRVGVGCSRSRQPKTGRHPAMIELLKPNNELVTLTKIDMDRQELQEWPPDDKFSSSNAAVLSMQHNYIVGITPKLPLQTVVLLDLYHNRLTSLKGLGNLPALRVLLLAKNRLTRLDGLSEVVRLEVLDLHGNQLQHLHGLSTLKKLRLLNAAGNLLREVSGLRGLDSLVELNLRRNLIRNVIELQYLPRLQKLFLAHNDIFRYEDISCVQSCLKLKELSLHHNPLSRNNLYFHTTVSKFYRLKRLDEREVTLETRKAAEKTLQRAKEREKVRSTRLDNQVSRASAIDSAMNNWIRLKNSRKKLIKAFSTANEEENEVADKEENGDKGNLPKCDEKEEEECENNPQQDNSQQSENSSENSTKNLEKTEAQLITESSNDDGAKSKENSENEISNEPCVVSNEEPNKTTVDAKPPCLQINIQDLSNELPFEDTIPPNPQFQGNVIPLKKSDKTLVRAFSSRNLGSSTTKSNSADIKNRRPKTASSTKMMSEEPHKSSTDFAKSNVQNIPTGNPASSEDSSSSEFTDGSQSVLTVKQSATSTNLVKKDSLKNILREKKEMSNHDSSNGTTSQPNGANSSGVLREQGQNFLVELSGGILNLYGTGALNCIDISWDKQSALTASVAKFQYVNFDEVLKIFPKLRVKFPKIQNFIFEETNLARCSQLNALAELHQVRSLTVGNDGNSIMEVQQWRLYAVFRLTHWGLLLINDIPVTEEEREEAMVTFGPLSQLAFLCLPRDQLSTLLAARSHTEEVRETENSQTTLESTKKEEQTLTAPHMQDLIGKEALQYRQPLPQGGTNTASRKAVHQMVLWAVESAMRLDMLESIWPSVLQDLTRDALADFSKPNYGKMQLDQIKAQMHVNKG